MVTTPLFSCFLLHSYLIKPDNAKIKDKKGTGNPKPKSLPYSPRTLLHNVTEFSSSHFKKLFHKTFNILELSQSRHLVQLVSQQL